MPRKSPPTIPPISAVHSRNKRSKKEKKKEREIHREIISPFSPSSSVSSSRGPVPYTLDHPPLLPPQRSNSPPPSIYSATSHPCPCPTETPQSCPPADPPPSPVSYARARQIGLVGRLFGRLALAKGSGKASERGDGGGDDSGAGRC